MPISCAMERFDKKSELRFENIFTLLSILLLIGLFFSHIFLRMVPNLFVMLKKDDDLFPEMHFADFIFISQCLETAIDDSALKVSVF